MKTLEQEAEEMYPGIERQVDRLIFIAGAESKWIQAEKIKAQIEILEKHIEHPTKPGYKRHDVLNTIKSLKSQLTVLQNDSGNQS